MEILPLLFLGLVFIGFYFLIIKPAKTRQLEAQATVARLAPGQEVMTTAGIYGTVREVTDETVSLEVSPGVTLTYAKVAIARILSPTEESAPESLPEDSGDERP
jgi:preprotein translocase subunit YajC